ncbi:MAG: hypothetical protein WC511_06750 [Candidatus Pacearchaeota archaeon]|jgi:co-chaperonin GroES (HSP10)
MTIKPKEGILLIRKHNKTALKADIVTVDDDEDKRLITGEVIAGGKKYPPKTTVIFGKYALYLLTIQEEDFWLLDEEDVVGTCNYLEK